jgi:sigma-B regulation protein RsbU (phosphoserine phosphatase)
VAGRGAGHSAIDLPWSLPATSDARLARALLGAGPVLLTKFPARGQAKDAVHHRELVQFERLRADTAIVASVRARGQVLGALTLVTNTPGRSLTQEDLPLVEDLAHRVGLAVDNAPLYLLQKQMAQRMQLSLLPRLRDIAPLRVAARYVPARESSAVGGDWYDCFRLADGAPALVIGDITGHDLQAAVQMSQVRNMTARARLGSAGTTERGRRPAGPRLGRSRRRGGGDDGAGPCGRLHDGSLATALDQCRSSAAPADNQNGRDEVPPGWA